MNWRDVKIDEMHKELEELKFVAEYPREFLLAYFKNLKQKLEIIMQSSIRPLINKELYLERIKTFELECLSSVSNYTKQIVSNESIYLIQMKLDLLSRNYILIDNFKEQCKEIDYLIYDELYRLQKYLFRSKTLIFLERKFNFTDECLICYDKKIKLILVNEFFGKKGLEIIRYVLILFDI
jgi:hypothetical protein